MEQFEIKCPKCKWEPIKESCWSCSCGHLWNTFDTAGKCPSCNKKWEDTQCPCCTKWSKHIDWYHIPFKSKIISFIRSKKEATAE